MSSVEVSNSARYKRYRSYCWSSSAVRSFLSIVRACRLRACLIRRGISSFCCFIIEMYSPVRLSRKPPTASRKIPCCVTVILMSIDAFRTWGCNHGAALRSPASSAVNDPVLIRQQDRHANNSRRTQQPLVFYNARIILQPTNNPI